MTPTRRQVHGFELDEFAAVASTQELLKQRLAEGEQIAGTVVRAGQQSLGKGRRGTPWASPRGGSYQSLALRAADLLTPAVFRGPTERIDGRLTLALGLGIARSLNGSGGRVLLKWPNDLILDDKKLGGIIVEVVAGTVIAGIGINVENEVSDSAAALRGWDVEAVSDLVLAGLRDGLELLRLAPEEFVLLYGALDWLRGREIEVGALVWQQAAGIAGERTTGTAVGTADGIEADGSLRVRQQDGSVVFIVSGHVKLISRQSNES